MSGEEWTGCVHCGRTLPHEGEEWRASSRCRLFQRIAEQAWREALKAVTNGVRQAKFAHAEHGHRDRDIVSSLAALELAIPATDNPYAPESPAS